MARYVFRALSIEDIQRINSSSVKQSIRARAPYSEEKSLYDAIRDGDADTRYISMTDRVSVADIKYCGLDRSNRLMRDSIVVLIDLDKLDSNKTHLGPAKECFKHNGSLNNPAINYTEADDEILYEDEIPPESYYEIPPLLLDIMTGYEITNSREENKDRICDLIVQGKSEELMTNLFSNVELNPIEKSFLEKYYGLIFEDNGKIRINQEKNQPLKGNIIGVERALKEEFGIMASNEEIKEPLLARCIQTQIIKSLNYKKAELWPLQSYRTPIREKIKAANMREGRYHVNFDEKELTDINKSGEERLSRRTLGGSLYYGDQQNGLALKASVDIPFGVRYRTTPEGYTAIQLYYSTLSYSKEKGEYRDSTEDKAGHGYSEVIYMASTQRENRLTDREALKRALGDLALTESELYREAQERRRIKEEERRREVDRKYKERLERDLLAGQQEEAITPEELTAIVRKEFTNPKAKFLNYKRLTLKHKRTRVELSRDEDFDKFATESIFDNPITFKSTSTKKPVQRMTISQLKTKQMTRRGKDGKQITYYVEVKENGDLGRDEYPSQYVYKVTIADLTDPHGLKSYETIKDQNSLRNFLSRMIDAPEIQR